MKHLFLAVAIEAVYQHLADTPFKVKRDVDGLIICMAFIDGYQQGLMQGVATTLAKLNGIIHAYNPNIWGN